MTQEHEYRISNTTSGQDMGTWTAASPEAAWAAMCDAAQAEDRTIPDDILIETLGYYAAVEPGEGIVWGIGRTEREAQQDAESWIGINLSHEEREGAMSTIRVYDCSERLYAHVETDGWDAASDMMYLDSSVHPTVAKMYEESVLRSSATDSEYSIAFMLESDGEFEAVESFTAANDAAANAYAERNYSGREWYVLDADGVNINA